MIQMTYYGGYPHRPDNIVKDGLDDFDSFGAHGRIMIRFDNADLGCMYNAIYLEHTGWRVMEVDFVNSGIRDEMSKCKIFDIPDNWSKAIRAVMRLGKCKLHRMPMPGSVIPTLGRDSRVDLQSMAMISAGPQPPYYTGRKTMVVSTLRLIKIKFIDNVIVDDVLRTIVDFFNMGI